MELEQQSLRKAAMKDRNKKAAAKWHGAKSLGRKSVEVARAEWESHVSGCAVLFVGGGGGVTCAPVCT